jgi:hypothetical protein
MTRIGYDATEWITEDCRRLLERDSVFRQICRGFLRVPLKLQRQASLYLGLRTLVFRPRSDVHVNATGSFGTVMKSMRRNQATAHPTVEDFSYAI